ncbi:polyketide cyclase [Sporanaerobacter acetigenes]|uniref:polyketide cyclase n=1 Tax=Sporanaerobacter acetigenes TaxID=165813 RepID=UPI001049AB57|nr:polyketide cyclase [Sporanaerobacter acetigenes]
MVISNIKATLPYDIKKVWDTVTSLENYSWRSNISKIEILNEKEFVEHTKDGYQTIFTTIAMEPYKLWKFSMENDNIRGDWTGLFAQEGNKTIIDFTENVVAKKVLMKPFVRLYLKRQQKTYIGDLKKVLRDSR